LNYSKSKAFLTNYLFENLPMQKAFDVLPPKAFK